MNIDYSHRSPNHSKRVAGAVVSCIVLHADADDHVESSLSWCMSPTSKVSYHYLIDRDGNAYELVDPSLVAWAVDPSEFPGATVYTEAPGWEHGKPHLNGRSISVCFDDRNDGEPYTDEEVAAGVKICVALMRRFPKITPDRITTHALVARPLGRKTDPLGFDLEAFRQRVARAGLVQ